MHIHEGTIHVCTVYPGRCGREQTCTHTTQVAHVQAHTYTCTQTCWHVHTHRHVCAHKQVTHWYLHTHASTLLQVCTCTHVGGHIVHSTCRCTQEGQQVPVRKRPRGPSDNEGWARPPGTTAAAQRGLRCCSHPLHPHPPGTGINAPGPVPVPHTCGAGCFQSSVLRGGP